MVPMFEGWDAVVLARAQFAFTMSFHIVFPAFSIGLASYLAVLEALWLWTGREVFINLFNYWLKIFAVAFGMCVVSGIVMSYQFGSNLAAFSDKAGPAVGPRVMFSMAMWMATLVAPIQILAGDQHGLNTLEHQPVKIMAMEGHFDSHPNGAPLILFGLPDEGAAKVKYAIEIPKMGSLILKHSPNAPIAGLDTVPRENWPPVPITFWSFRTMVGMGFLMLGLGLFSLWTRWPGTLYQTRLLRIFAMAMGPAGFISWIARWVTTETGRQPFTVYGLLRTVDSASPLAAPAVGSSQRC